MTQQSAACLCIHVCRCSPAFLHMTAPELHPHTPCWADHPNLPGRQAEGWGTGPPLPLCGRWTRRGRPSSTWSSRPTCRSGRGSGTGCGALRRDPPPPDFATHPPCPRLPFLLADLPRPFSWSVPLPPDQDHPAGRVPCIDTLSPASRPSRQPMCALASAGARVVSLCALHTQQVNTVPTICLISAQRHGHSQTVSSSNCFSLRNMLPKRFQSRILRPQLERS